MLLLSSPRFAKKKLGAFSNSLSLDLLGCRIKSPLGLGEWWGPQQRGTRWVYFCDTCTFCWGANTKEKYVSLGFDMGGLKKN